MNKKRKKAGRPNKKSEKVGAGVLALRYDGKKRLVGARAKSGSYSADLVLNPAIPKGKWSNSFGDTSVWAKGVHEAESSFGTWEQSEAVKITYKAWVKQMLDRMKAGLRAR